MFEVVKVPLGQGFDVFGFSFEGIFISEYHGSCYTIKKSLFEGPVIVFRSCLIFGGIFSQLRR